MSRPTGGRDGATYRSAKTVEDGTRPRHALRVVGLAALLAAFILTTMWGVRWLQRSLLFPGTGLPCAAEGAPPGERWWVETSSGRVEAWWLPGDGVSASQPGPAVVFAHGNGELIDHWPGPLAPYRALGVSVLLPEYRGYGRSAGRPSEAALAEDLQAVLERLRGDPRVDASRIVYHGRSLGGGVIATALAQAPPRALILESTFTSVPEVVPRIPAALITDRFESLGRVRAYPGPTLLFHGRRDGVVPVSHGQRLAASARDAELVLYDCGHNDLPPRGHGADYWGRIEGFLTQHGALSARTEVVPSGEGEDE